MEDSLTVHWTEGGEARSAQWRSESGAPPPKQVIVADDRMSADEAYGLAGQGTALLWRGDFQNARQMLVALRSRSYRQPHRRRKRAESATPAEAFHLHRQAQAQRARTLGMLLVPLDKDYTIPLRRAPDLRQACTEAWGPPKLPSIASLRELLGVVGAHEWKLEGIDIPAAGGRVHPHYGVFSPIRREYVDLVEKAPLPAALATASLAFDIGTGTGVLAAVLAKRGVERVIATDQDRRALNCAIANVARLKVAKQVQVVEADLFPEGKAALVVCNPPWVPARPSSPLERGIFDPESRMLKGFLGALAAHLEPEGEGWLILSDFAEHLGLRSRDELLAMIEAAGLKVVDRLDTRPKHPKAADEADPLHAARAAEVTSLWRLAAR
ncbi:MAG: class I SAM-dependent methyltransferase [Betaproteobacteria bacterium]|nr:class I SAM-dependent methyltransferase [Betaproteobacteria bacterium]